MSRLDLARPEDLALFRAGDDEQLLAQAEARVRKMCGWHIAPVRQDTVTVDADPGAPVLFLPTMRIVSVDAIVAENGTAVSVANYTVHSEEGSLVLHGQNMVPSMMYPVPPWWYQGPLSYQVTFTHGYDSVPEDVQKAVMTLAEQARSQQASGNLARLRIDDVDRYYFDPGQQQSIDDLGLSRYRVPPRF